MPEMVQWSELRWNEQGLLPAVVQDIRTGEVLMVAWMNEQSLRVTIETGEANFWSRSRQELWHKGAVSGNRQLLRALSVDCDADTLLLQVEPLGPACHTGAASCFFRSLAEVG
jgi:phosphoribosyl-AMP cyclohydrolase